jgi:hypothetical protein
MTIVSLDRAPPVVVALRTRRRSWFARVIDAVYESRMRSAQAVIARYRGVMPIATKRTMEPPLRLVALGAARETVANDARAIVARTQRR